MTEAGIPKRPKRIVHPKQKVTSGDLSYTIPKHDVGYDDEEVDKWFKEAADRLEKRIMMLNERLKEEPYPWITTDALILQAGISLLKELLEALR